MQLRGSKAGSALIMVMLVVAGITTIVFSTQRIALVQFSQSVREEDNLTAYYAAQAGIEDGLVRYRFEKNTEIYKDSDNNLVKYRLNLTQPSSLGANEISLDTAIDEGVIIGGNSDYDPNYQYYDLVMNYKTQRINIDGVNGDRDFSLVKDTIIKRDEVLTLSGFSPKDPDPASAYFLRYAFEFINENSCDIANAFTTLHVERISDAGRSSEQVLAKNPGGTNVYDSIDSSNLDISDSGTSTVSSIRIRAYHCDVKFAFVTTLNPLGNGVGGDAGPEFDGLFTEIVSTGYYGSAKRTLIAQVDRQTGNLIGIFDYILYSGGNDPLTEGNIGR